MGGLFTYLKVLVNIFASFKDLDFSQWLNWTATYLYLTIVRRLKGRRLNLYNYNAFGDPEKMGYLVPHQEWELESPQERSTLKTCADNVSCFGVNSKSEFLSIKVARKPNSIIRCSLILRLANGKTYTLPEQHVLQQETEELHTFGSSRLKMKCLLPMRKWRIFFNGLMKEMSSNRVTEDDKYVHVKFAFIWTASSDVYDFYSDASSLLLADSVAAYKTPRWPIPLVERIKNICNVYEQPGMLLGTVTVEGEEEKEVYLWGSREHFMGQVRNIKDGRYTHIYSNAENGTLIHLGVLNLPGLVSKLSYGYVMRPNGYIFPIDKCEYSEIENKERNELEVICFAGEKSYALKMKKRKEIPFQNECGRRSSLIQVDLSINDMKGKGLLLEGFIHREHKIRKRKNTYASSAVNETTAVSSPYGLSFDDPLCENVNITGGKGSSLAKLKRMSKEIKTFTVPKGIVVTTAAYSEFIKGNLENSLTTLENVIWGRVPGDRKAACEKVMKEVCSSELSQDITQSIQKAVKLEYGDQMDILKFAVRSSATGEDTEQMSAAGQMETFLGCSGITEILEAVKKCWASQFSFVAVEYKRHYGQPLNALMAVVIQQMIPCDMAGVIFTCDPVESNWMTYLLRAVGLRYGQPLNAPMAVVIQQMIPCDVAGVIFTCDPVTGNPEYINITANYGLGESVVSARAEPDTVILKRDITNKIQKYSTLVGSKKTKIVMDESARTKEEEVSEEQTKDCSLSEESAFKLGNIAIKIEDQYGSPRDIEWGIQGTKVFLLQGRPVTSIDLETDFEIKHEYDTYLRREDEYGSKANVGEVLPGSTSPLGIEVMNKLSVIAFTKQTVVKWEGEQMHNLPYFPTRSIFAYNHIFFNLADGFFRFSENENETNNYTKALCVAIFGRIIDDQKLFEMAKDRHGSPKKQPIKSTIASMYIMMLMFFAGYFTKRVSKKFKHYRIPVENNTSAEILRVLGEHFQDIYVALNSHMDCTFSSPLWNMMMLALLAKAKGDWNNEVYSDFAYLLSACSQVESADVPAAIQNLAFFITKCIEPETFKSMDVETAFQWLQTSSSEAGIKFRNFLKNHGHRCWKEFDVYSDTWEMNPKPLVKMLQGFAGQVTSDAVEKKNISFATILSNLHVSLSFTSRLFLRFLLPNCRRGVREREISKSFIVRAMNSQRQAYRLLAKVMVQEGRLPNEDILFFMSIEEINQLIKTRSPRLVSNCSANPLSKIFYETLGTYGLTIWPIECTKGHSESVSAMESAPRNGQTYISRNNYWNSEANVETEEKLYNRISVTTHFPSHSHMINMDDDIDPQEKSLTMTGVPVSQGVVKATARVVLNLDEAESIQPGDVLITYSTDIGWSPYFPLLSGVVTELGGLISHGAVVAREYGLPCVVSLHGATRIFKSGDKVLLDGNRGLLQKLEED